MKPIFEQVFLTAVALVALGIVTTVPSAVAAPPAPDGATQWELFDYEGDPGETRNHASAQPHIVRALQAEIDRGPRIAAGGGKSGKARKTAPSTSNP